MIDAGSLEFTQARVLARHGQRADELAWHRLQDLRDLSALLAAIRTTAMRPWVSGLTARSSWQQVEAALDLQWLRCVDETARWMPGCWRPALQWCALLPELPATQHLARGGAVREWMRDDPTWNALAEAAPGDRAVALAAGAAAPLATAWAEPDAMGAAWYAEWRRRLPRSAGRAGDGLEHLSRVLLSHGAAFAQAPPGSGELLRRQLQSRLTHLLRRYALEPAVAFIHLALSALDLERLRGELLRRALFPEAKVA